MECTPKKLQERLLDRGEELTLAKAIEIGQQYEMSQKQVRVVRDEEPTILALDPKKRRIRRIRRNLTLEEESTAPGVAKTLSMTGIKENVLPWDQHAPTVRSPNHWLAVCNRRLRVHKIDTSSDG